MQDPNAPNTPSTTQPSWLPPGYTLNPDGSITAPGGQVMPAPGPGQIRDPQTGQITYAPGSNPSVTIGQPFTDTGNTLGPSFGAPPTSTPPPVDTTGGGGTTTGPGGGTVGGGT